MKEFCRRRQRGAVPLAGILSCEVGRHLGVYTERSDETLDDVELVCNEAGYNLGERGSGTHLYVC